jgi:hypothetical protein
MPSKKKRAGEGCAQIEIPASGLSDSAKLVGVWSCDMILFFPGPFREYKCVEEAAVLNPIDGNCFTMSWAHLKAGMLWFEGEGKIS